MRYWSYNEQTESLDDAVVVTVSEDEILNMYWVCQCGKYTQDWAHAFMMETGKG